MPLRAGAVPVQVPTTENACLQKILESQTFQKSPACRSLLLYLWEHRAGDVSEYAVGVEALGRRSDFDPRTDATVRVHVSRLRQKLKEYYDGEDPASAIRLTIPLGGHVLHVANAPAEPAPPLPKQRDWRLITVGTAAAVLALLALGLLVENRRQAGEIAARPSMPRFWRAFFAGGKPTSLIMPTPTFFIWEDRRWVARDVLVNEYGKHTQSPFLQPLVKELGPPRLLQNYTVVSDAVATARLAQHLERYGEKVSVAQAPELSLDSFGDRNLILFGMTSTSDHLNRLTHDTNFYLPFETAAIVKNRRPLAGEPPEWYENVQSDTRRSTPCIIVLRPGKAPGTKILLLGGRQTLALVSYLSSGDGLQSLDEMWNARGAPEFFEAVVRAEVDALNPLGVVPLALRPFHVTR